jgi:hypothetical protein
MARRRASTVSFEAIVIEGASLATDMLARIAAIEATEQTEADYYTPPGLKLRDEIGRYYRIGEAHWAPLIACARGTRAAQQPRTS